MPVCWCTIYDDRHILMLEKIYSCVHRRRFLRESTWWYTSKLHGKLSSSVAWAGCSIHSPAKSECLPLISDPVTTLESVDQSVDLPICRSVDSSICRPVDFFDPSVCRPINMSICRYPTVVHDVPLNSWDISDHSTFWTFDHLIMYLPRYIHI